MNRNQIIRLPIEKLVVGLMVDIELSWTKHPFLFSKFKITSKADIAIIKQLGLKEVIEPEKLAENKWHAKNNKLEKADQFRNTARSQKNTLSTQPK